MKGTTFLQHQHLISSLAVIGACDYLSVHHLEDRGKGKTCLIRFLPSSTTLEENSNFRVNWEQLESQEDGCCGSVVGLDPPNGSVPNKGRKPTSSPKRTDPHTGNRSMLTC